MTAVRHSVGRKPTAAGLANLKANAGKGRVKGVPNKTTTLAKTAIAEAFDKLGGTDALVAWAKRSDDHLKVFYGTIYPKLLPLQVTGNDGGPVEIYNASAATFDARVAGIVAAIASASAHVGVDDSGQGAA